MRTDNQGTLKITW